VDAGGSTIWIDDDGAGRGWFIDSTPNDDSEFVAGSTLAAGRYDLLTMISHELGHAVGLPDLNPATSPNELMASRLATGIRRSPSPQNCKIGAAVTGYLEGDFLNGDFAVSDPASLDFGWSTRGTVSINNGVATLRENATELTRLSQTFIVPAGAISLRITFNDVALIGDNGPPDAFEVALLDADTLTTLIGTATGLNQTDAFLNIQRNGQIYFGSQVTVPGMGSSGGMRSLTGPMTITIDLTGIAAGTEATLFFDLLGFAPLGSRVEIAAIEIITVPLPTLSLSLTSASDNGVRGDGITNIATVQATGTTTANQVVTADLDGDGQDDRTLTADANGQFSFTNFALIEGANRIRLRAGNISGVNTQFVTFTLDTQSVSATLIAPIAGSEITQDLGYVDVQWSDNGAAGVEPISFDVADVTITGVDIDSVEHRGNGLVRYHYGVDGDELPIGTVTVNFIAGAVADHAGNLAVGTMTSFILRQSVSPPNPGIPVVPVPPIVSPPIVIPPTIPGTPPISPISPPSTPPVTPQAVSPIRLVDRRQPFAIGESTTVTHLSPSGAVIASINPFGAGYTRGVRVASGDLNGDGVADIITGTGQGSTTEVVVFDGRTGSEIFRLTPFETTFTGGVYVAAGDVDGDGIADLAISAGDGGGTRVRVFQGGTFTQLADFFGIDDPDFRGGSHIAVADINGDGRADVLVSAGLGGGPRVAVYDGMAFGMGDPVKLWADFFAFDSTERSGIFIAGGDVTGDGKAEVVAANDSQVLLLSGASLLSGTPLTVAQFAADGRHLRIAVKERNGDGLADLIVAHGARVSVYSGADLKGDSQPAEQEGYGVASELEDGVFVG